MRPRETAASSRGLTWPMVVMVLAIIAGTVLAWWSLRPSPIAAKVDEYKITRSALASAMRAELWRQGADWTLLSAGEKSALREKALGDLIDGHLVSQLPATPSPRQSEEAFQQFIRQFETDEMWRGRAAGQDLNEVTLREGLTLETSHISALAAAMALKSAPPTEAEARTWFDAHRDSLHVPERVHASHLFLSGHDREKPDREQEIREFHRQLMTQESTLGALAARLSEDGRSKKKSGDLGWFSRERIPKDFADVVFAMVPGTMSSPFQTRLGWHIVFLQEKLPARPAEFHEMLPEIMALLDTKRRTQQAQAVLSDLRAAAEIRRHEAVLTQVMPAE